MQLLVALLRAAHCYRTHHFLAVDALPLAQTDAGARLSRILAAHHGHYLRGAVDPDERYRDFHHHVIQVADAYWGQAPRVAHGWYDYLQQSLRRSRLAEAAHAAGVLSHYFTDPLQPLHTISGDRESALHQPIEWCVERCYRRLYREWCQNASRVVFQLSDRPGWLGEAMLHGARLAHRHHRTLLDGFRLRAAIENPGDGFSREARAVLSDLIGLAVTGWARVLERAAWEAERFLGHPLPATNPAPAVASAICRLPDRWLAGVVSHHRLRRAVEAIAEEYRRTGRVIERLPVEVDIVRRVLRVVHDERRWQAAREIRTRRTQSGATVPVLADGTTPAAAGRGDRHQRPPLQVPKRAA